MNAPVGPPYEPMIAPAVVTFPAIFSAFSPTLPSPCATLLPTSAVPFTAFLAPFDANFAGAETTFSAFSNPLANLANLADFNVVEPSFKTGPPRGTSIVGSAKFAPKLTKFLASSVDASTIMGRT